MQKILLLGGSAQQIVAIKAAKTLGYYTVLCDYLLDNPGQYEADVFYQVSTTDVDAVYEVALKENVDGILAYASDPAALPAAIVAERLGLPTNPAKSVEILGLKYRWRDFLQKNGFACPKHYAFSPSVSIVDLKMSVFGFQFPLVLKPTDSSGSKGVTVLNTLDGIESAIAWAKSYSRNEILIIEEFIERGFPDVIGGDIFVWNGKIILYGEMSCLRDEKGRSLIPIGKKRPSGLSQSQMENVHSELQRLIDSLNIHFGEMNIEILLDKDDNVHFLELGPRAGGNMISLQLSDAMGVDLVKANVLAAMGVAPDLTIHPNDGCFMTFVLHSHTDGNFSHVEYAEEIKSCVYREVIYKKNGDVVEKFDGAGKAIGIVFLRMDDEEKMNDFCRRIDELIKVVLR